MKIKRPEMFNQASKGGNSNLLRIILMFFVVVYIVSLIESIPAVIISLNEIKDIIINGDPIENIENLEKQLLGSRSYMYAVLYGTLLGSIAIIFWCHFNEKRSLQSLGFRIKNALRDYAIGMLIGFVMFSLVVGINLLTGAITIENATESISLGTLVFILLFFIGFLLQGAFEEILLRGYFMVNIGAKHKMFTAIIVSSIAFAIMHGANPGITLLSIINLTLIAIFFALYIICFDNIWGACAIHGVWNFVQGNFYGISVSGMNVFESIFISRSVPGKEFINGGAFGVEGGISTTIVIILSIIILLVYMKMNGKIEKTTKEVIYENTKK